MASFKTISDGVDSYTYSKGSSVTSMAKLEQEYDHLMVDTEDKLDSQKPAEQQQYATYDYSIPYGSSYLANLNSDFTRSADSN